MIYYTIAKHDYGYLIDSISENYEVLKNKFPDETIYQSDKPILTIYVMGEQLQYADLKKN